MRIRIKKITRKNGNVEYIPQQRILLFFWETIKVWCSSDGWGLDGWFEDATFDSEESAREYTKLLTANDIISVEHIYD